jgi:uncharacterized protein YjiS (DUF1127 family)
MSIRHRPYDPEGALFRYRVLRAFVAAAVARWRRRSTTRRELRRLGERDLRDIGLSTYDRERESAKWFWQR